MRTTNSVCSTLQLPAGSEATCVCAGVCGEAGAGSVSIKDQNHTQKLSRCKYNEVGCLCLSAGGLSVVDLPPVLYWLCFLILPCTPQYDGWIAVMKAKKGKGILACPSHSVASRTCLFPCAALLRQLESWGQLRMDVKKRFFAQRVTGHWNRLSRRVRTAPILTELKECLDVILGPMVGL